MEKNNIILILVIILLVILIFFTKCGENFESAINYKPLTTNIFNVLYTIYENNDIVLLTNFNNDSDYAKIYELENIFNEKYYNIYFKDNILKYINDEKIDFYLDSAQNISEFYQNYRFYKSPNNKLYYTINNQNKYLAIDKNNINVLKLSNNEEDAITWNF